MEKTHEIDILMNYAAFILTFYFWGLQWLFRRLAGGLTAGCTVALELKDWHEATARMRFQRNVSPPARSPYLLEFGEKWQKNSKNTGK